MNKASLVWWILFVVGSIGGQAWAAPLVNGDFEAGTNGWAAEGSVTVEVTAGNDFAVFEENPYGAVSRIHQVFDLPTSPHTLSFQFYFVWFESAAPSEDVELWMEAGDPSEPFGEPVEGPTYRRFAEQFAYPLSGFPPDSFSAFVLDPDTLERLLPPPGQPPAGFDDFFFVDNTGLIDFNPDYVTMSDPDEFGLRTVTLDISSLPGRRAVHLEFGLAGGPDGSTSFAIVDNVVVGQDCNTNGIVDSEDIAAGTSQDCNSDGLPDECVRCPCIYDLSGDCFINLDDFGLFTACFGCSETDPCWQALDCGHKDFDCSGFVAGADYSYLQGAWLKTCAEVDASAFPECRACDGPVVCQLPSGPTDCNDDGVLDECDIAGGTSEDCQSNGIPDECDIAGHTSEDCQTNGIPDECDIASLTSADCNSNGVPDECELSTAEVAKLTPSNSTEGDWFGFGVALSGDRAIVGAQLDDDGGADAGAAYIFRREGQEWVEEDKLTASDAAAGDRFGYSVAISGSLAVVGAYLDDDAGSGTGSAYVLRREGNDWVEEAKLTASDAASQDRFGISVAIDGDAAVVGAYWDDDAGSASGSAYVFRRNGGSWTQEAKLTASDAAYKDKFGVSVSMDGDLVLVGRSDDDAAARLGSAYIFRRQGGGWVEEAQLTAADVADHDRFGYAVSISRNVAVVGAFLDDGAGADSGSAYLFRFDGASWIQEGKLAASDATTGDRFGISAAIRGHVLVVGADQDDDAGADSGSAYVFRFDGASWNQEAKLTASDAAAGDSFGRVVSVNGDLAIVGAYLADDGGTDSGSAYMFSVGRDCNGNGVPDECDISGGTSMDCNTNGIPDECEADCNSNGIEDGCDITSGTSGDCQSNGIPDECEADCNSNQVPDNCDIASSTSEDCNANGTPDECEMDCNMNGTPDDCETFEDCNTNGILDECDLEAGTSSDCNSNSLPDECELTTAEMAKLSSSDSSAGDWFGFGVAVSEDRAIVGAQLDDDGGPSAGSAYVFRREGWGWVGEYKLTASDAAAGDRFGYSVAISGNLAIVGAYLDDGAYWDSGSAYVFRREGGVWVEEAKLTASDPAYQDRFGISVAIDGDAAIVGAYWDDDLGSASGSAYVFRRNGGSWTEEAKLTASDGASSDTFGSSVSIDGDVVVVNASRNDDDGTDSGSAYIFRREGGSWVEETKLTALDAAGGDQFGAAVSMSGNVAVVGAFLDDDAGADSGSAYVFRFDGASWIQEAKLTASDAAAGDRFGISAAIRRHVVVVGADQDDDAGADSGSAYVFRFDGASWIQEAKLTASDAAAGDSFGRVVSLSGDAALVGAYLADGGGTDSGSAYMFSLGRDCNGNGVPDECDIAGGTSTDCNTNGVPDACDITVGTSSDCNGNDVPDECVIIECPPIDLVFIMDTSNSMVDEKDALCGVIDHLVADLQQAGMVVSAEILDIPPGGGRYDGEEENVPAGVAGGPLNPRGGSCWEDSVADLYGVTLNGLPEILGACAGDGIQGHEEDWGPATAIVAANKVGHLTHPWTPGAVRIIVPMSDEGPRCGDPVNTNGDDRAAIDHAIPFVAASQTVVSPIVGIRSPEPPPNPDVVVLAEVLATGGAPGGQVFLISTNGVSSEEMRDHIIGIMTAACTDATDCNFNRTLDDCDIAGGTSIDCNGNGIPDECDITSPTGADCNSNGTPDECEMDCNMNGTPDDCEPSVDCNSNGILDECDLQAGTSSDCNGDSVPDVCEITAGTSPDCNTNGVPDECDIIGGTSLDCNTNGVPDECDIAGGTSGDCNANSWPDECDVEVCTSGLWDGFEPDPPFSFLAPLAGIDYNGDGFAWANPVDPPTAVIFPFGCEAGDIFDNAVQVVVDDSLSNPADGYVASEYFQTEDGEFLLEQRVYALVFRAKLEELDDAQVDWEFSIHDGTNTFRSVVLRFNSTASLSGGFPGFITVQNPAGSPAQLSTGVPILIGQCYEFKVVLDNVSNLVSVYIDGELKVQTTRLTSVARRMDYFRIRPVLNGASGHRVTVFRLDRVDLCLTDGAGAPGEILDCNSNGVLDACDISEATSEDVDGNGTPDECQARGVHGPPPAGHSGGRTYPSGGPHAQSVPELQDLARIVNGNMGHGQRDWGSVEAVVRAADEWGASHVGVVHPNLVLPTCCAGGVVLLEAKAIPAPRYGGCEAPSLLPDKAERVEPRGLLPAPRMAGTVRATTAIAKVTLQPFAMAERGRRGSWPVVT